MSAMLKSKENLLPREGALLTRAETVMADLRNLADSVTSAHYGAWKEGASELRAQ
jgi:hypothetical protein